MLARLSLALLALMAGSCDGGGGDPVCVPGASLACTGAGGCSGFQLCNAEGTGLEPCLCDGETIDASIPDIPDGDVPDPPDADPAAPDADPTAPDAAPPPDARPIPDARPPGAPDANPAEALLLPCPGTLSTGQDRNCGWESKGAFPCTPGVRMFATCSATCGAGTCTGDSVMRVCAGTTPCLFGTATTTGNLGNNDDSGCGITGDTCSEVPNWYCPTSGMVTILVGAWDPFGTATCEPVVRLPP